MLDGWYCRTLANEQAGTGHNQHDDDENEPNVADSGSDDSHEPTSNKANAINRPVNYKEQYKYLKQKLKFLLYENEFFQDALRTSQRRLLKVSRDRSFLLDRLLQYEKPEGSSSESEETESSDESSKIETKKRKHDNTQSSAGNKNNPPAAKKKKIAQQKQKNSPNVNQTMNQSQSQQQHQHLQQQQQQQHQQQQHQTQQIHEGHMTAEEVERHLQSRQSITELMPERAPPTVPTEMFSNEPSLDSESNDQMIETSPSNIGEDCVSVEMNIKNEFIKTEYQS